MIFCCWSVNRQYVPERVRPGGLATADLLERRTLFPSAAMCYKLPGSPARDSVHGISHHHVRLPDRRDVRTVGFDVYKENVGG